MMSNDYENMEADDDFKDELKYLEIRRMLEKADNAVITAVAATAATGAIPIPFADAPLLIGEQVTLMATIAGIFKINVKKDGLKTLAIAAIGVGGTTVLGKTIVSNVLKLVPGVGSVAGGAISGGTAGAITLAMGKAFIEVCKKIKMGKLNDDELTSSKGVNMLKAEFRKQFKKKKK